MNKKALGEKIRRERQKFNLTQEKLAEDIDISTAYMGQIERGERGLTLDTLTAIVNRLDVTLDFLLSDSIPIKDENMYQTWSQLMAGRTEKEKQLAIDLVKTVFHHLRENNNAKGGRE